MQLNNHSLEYIDSQHLYLVDGVIAPSVTQVMKLRYGTEYLAVPPATLQAAADAGTKMHQAIQDYEQTGATDDSLELHNYRFLKERWDWKCLECEKPVILEHGGHYYAGRLDMVVEIDHQLGLLDFKRRSSVNREELAMQLNLYRLGYAYTYGETPFWLAGVQLRENTRKVLTCPINEAVCYELLDEYAEQQKKVVMDDLPF